MLDHNIIWKATEGKGGGSFNMPPHGGWGITVDGSDETVVAHNLIGYTADGNLYLRDWGEVTDESQPVGRGLNWIPDSGGATLRLDLDAWQKFFGFDRKGGYAEMSIEVDLDALTMTWSFSGPTPQVPTEKHFLRDLLGESASPLRRPGPLLHLPDSPTKVAIDPRRIIH